MVTGHVHSQLVKGADDAENEIAPTPWVISGGGGGIPSDGMPSLSSPDDQYGFMHMTMSKEELRIVNIDHNGIEGRSVVAKPRPCLDCHTATTASATTTETASWGP